MVKEGILPFALTSVCSMGLVQDSMGLSCVCGGHSSLSQDLLLRTHFCGAIQKLLKR